MSARSDSGRSVLWLRNPDTILGVSFIVVAAVFVASTFSLSAQAAMWPRVVLAILVVLGGAIAVRGARSPAAAGGEWAARTLRGPAVTLLVVVCFVALVSVVGFFPATVVYLCGHLWFGGVRDPWVFVGVTVVFVGLVYLLFVYELQVPLPTGLLVE